MKLKSDFITNSSSASFIMSFKTKDNINHDEFRTLFNKYLESYKRQHPNKLRFWDASIISKGTDDKGDLIYTVEDGTTMYNDMHDIPEYMRLLMIESYVNEYDWGFQVVGFKVEDEHY